MLQHCEPALNNYHHDYSMNLVIGKDGQHQLQRNFKIMLLLFTGFDVFSVVPELIKVGGPNKS
jgi:hypothetical protein